MRTWESLAQEAASLRNQADHWLSNFSKEIQSALQSFDRLCITRLETLLSSSLPDRNKNKEIKRFFAMRWTVIANTSLDYTLNPSMPANTWYMAIATRIAEPDEAIIKILIPTIKKVIGAGMENDITASTESSGRRIELQNFILNANQDSLISVDDVLNYAKLDTNYLFPAIQIEGGTDPQSTESRNKILFPLSASDRETLRQITPETTYFFDLLKQVHTVRYNQKPSVGFALFELYEALLRSSKIDSGADVAANMSECQQPILNFYHVWVSLSDEDRKKIADYHAQGGSATLQGFLLTLFSYTPGVELSDADYASVDPHIVPCTHMIGLQLKTLLAQHVELNNMALPGREIDFYLDAVPTHDALSEAQEKCILSLSQRKVIAGKCNSQITSYEPFFAAFTDNLLDSNYIAQQILKIQSKIKNILDLRFPLLLLPENKWNHLLFLSRENISNRMTDSRYSSIVQSEGVLFVSQILKSIPSPSWKDFFYVMSAQRYNLFLNGESLSGLLYEFNESRWKEMVGAMDQYPTLILSDPRDIALLLSATHIEHFQIMGELFHAPMALTLNIPMDYAELFKFTSREIWHPIFSLFSRTLIYYIQNHKFIDEVFKILEPARRLSFITLLMRSGVARADIIKNLHHILPHLETLDWQELFRITQINCAEYLSSSLQFTLLLNNLDVALWRDLNGVFKNNIRAILMDPEKLGFVLLALPENKWQHLFAEFYDRGTSIPSDYFVGCLSKTTPEKRLKIAELLFHKISDLVLQAERLADILNLFAVADWPAFSKLVEKRYVMFSHAIMRDIDGLLKKMPVEKWGALKNIFGSRFDNALRDETSLILCARELPAEKVGPFFLLVSHLVHKHITSINFLKTIVYHVKDEEMAQIIALSILSAKIQIDPNVNPFSLNLSEAVTVFSRIESVQKNNTHLVLEILGEREVSHYLRSVLPFPEHADLSQLSVWKTHYVATPAIISLFLDSPVSFALIFYAVSTHEWSKLATLLSKSLTLKLRDCSFLRAILLYLPLSVRSHFCAAVFPFINPPSISLGLFAPVFSVLPKNDWTDFYMLIKTRKIPLFLRDNNEFFSLLDGNDFDNFDAWYSLLNIQIDQLLKHPFDIKNLFSHFDIKFWPKVAIRCNQMLTDHFEKIDFLKDTLNLFQKENRFCFLKSIAPFFDDIPINSVMLMNMLKLIPFSQWAGFLALFGKHNLYRALTNESDLLLVLDGIRNYRHEFLSMIKDQVPNIRCDHPMQLMHLLKSFPNMQNLILDLFRGNLADVLKRFISYFMLVEDSNDAIADAHSKSCFDFLSDKFLPILFSKKYLKDVLDSDSEDDLEIVQKLFDDPDSPQSRNGSLWLKYPDINCYRVALLREFIQEVKRDSLCEKPHPVMSQQVIRERVCSKLVAHFGLYFFEKIMQYASCFAQVHTGQLQTQQLWAPLPPPGIRPNRVVFFPQRSDAQQEINTVVARLYPATIPPRENAGAATAQQQGVFLEHLFLTPPRPRQ